MNRIAVIGLGQIGGSLVLALRNAGINADLIGIDPSLKRRKLLEKYLDVSSTSWSVSLSADLIFVCLHFKLIEKFLKIVKTKALIVDVCSSKASIVQLANRRRLRMIGGHPMAGTEHKGEKGWNPELFKNAPFFLCPAQTSSASDLNFVKRLLRRIGARPLVVKPAQHDHAVAITSHLPAMIAHAYAKIAKNIPSYFYGPGFRSFTRPGKCSNELLQTFQLSNRKNIQKTATKFKRELSNIV